jgi:hypothetical protein
MRVLSRITIPNNIAAPTTNSEVSGEERLENVKSDEGQATIENFLKEEED